MTALRVALSRLLDLAFRRRRDARLDEEVQTHLKLLEAEHQARGMSPAQATASARRSFGGVDQIKQIHRERRGLPIVDALAQDVRFAVRLMRKDPWFTAAAVIALALGIGANSTVFAITNAALLRDLPFADPDRIVALGTRDSREPFVKGPLGYRGVSYRDFEDWRVASGSFESLAAYVNGPFNLSDDVRAPERLLGTFVSANLFALLGEPPVLGRDFRPDDDRPGAAPVVILGHSVWAARFGADPDIIGSMVRANGVPATVIGVMPPRFGFPMVSDLWQPLVHRPELATQPRDARGLEAIGRLVDGISLAQAESELAGVAARLARDYPSTNAHVVPTLSSYGDRHLALQMTWLFAALMGAVGCVLLIACANVANLLLARSTTRARELAVRASLGASRGRMIRQLLVETSCLAVIAAALGFVIAAAGVRSFATTVAQTGAPYWLRFELDRTALVYLAATCLGTAMLAGFSPALHLSRTETIQVLKEGGRGAHGGVRVRRWTGSLIVSQVAMTLMLLAAAGFMAARFLDLYRLDLGVDTSQLATMRLDLPPAEYQNESQRLAFYRRLDERLAASTTIGAIAIANVPLTSAGMRPFAISGREISESAPRLRVSVVVAGPRYFETLGLEIPRGRGFTGRDGEPGQEHAIVNQLFADTYFPDADPVGERLELATGPTASAMRPVSIVGVAPTVGRQHQATVYVPLQWEPVSAATLVVRSSLPLTTLADALRAEVRALDDDLPLFGVETIEQALAFARWPERVFGSIFTIAAAIGLTMSAIGLFAVIKGLVAQRTHEVGVRMALGARSAQVTWLIMRRTTWQLAAGLAIGTPVAIGIGLALPFGSRNLMVLLPVMLLLVVVAVAACWIPARRAARLDPIVALRQE